MTRTRLGRFDRLVPVVMLLACLRPDIANAQVPPAIRLSGYVRSAASGEVVRYATIRAVGQGTHAESNQDGFFILSLPAGPLTIQIRAVGFDPLTDTLTLAASVTRDFLLTPRPLTLEEIRVEGSASRDSSDIDPSTPEMSTARLDVQTIKLVPVVLGELDPIRSLTLLPGVTSLSDFSTGFSVRGGGADQNLIRLDESTIYNPSHVFGFFSVFNGDAVDDIKLYKGAIPARFGGRLSSVLDVHQREGNSNEFEGAATIGLLASRLALEGPLPGGAGSWLVAGRRTYADLFLKLSSDPDLNRNVAYFYDLNAKGNVRLGKTGTLMLSGYFGRDKFSIADNFGASWGNSAGILRWNQAFGGQLFSKTTLTVSDYDYGIDFLGDGADLRWTSRIGNIDLNILETWHLSNTSILEFGAEVARQRIRPGTITPVEDSPVNPTELEARHGLAPALFASHQVELSRRVSLQYGLRLAGYWRTGPATVYQYANDAPVTYNQTLGRYERGQVVDSTSYTGGATIASFTGLEPRISIRFGLSDASSLKLGYSRTRQYIHLISNTNSPTPVDIWEPVGSWLDPQTSDQVALGYVTTSGGGEYELSMEAYYKSYTNLTDFIDGADISLNDRLETEMLPGNGRSYGLELYARKQTGKLTGWVSYTLGRSERRVPGLTPDDPGINNGEYYVSPYDKTHDLSVVGLYPLGRSWTLGGTFILSSGLPATYPVSRYEYDGVVVAEYGPRNGARLPIYHRLDLTFTRTTARTQLQLGLFNVYNRFNAQSISFLPSEENPLLIEPTQISIFGIVPSVNFSFRF
jgi:hypothetical protein